ncbi:MAG: hypothetical protein IT290_12480, partial [Deltaproteobacteria bacterium]|nr:hypothetical protein [Deltaproteobacteria bacterium]
MIPRSESCGRTLIRRVTVFCIALCAFSGCLPMGLPDHFADIAPVSGGEVRTEATLARALESVGYVPQKRSVLIVASNAALQAAAERETLGTQFLLGLIPLTRLYLAHGMDSLVHESLLSAALDSNLQPFETSEAFADHAASILGLDRAISVSSVGISVNAY